MEYSIDFSKQNKQALRSVRGRIFFKNVDKYLYYVACVGTVSGS